MLTFRSSYHPDADGDYPHIGHLLRYARREVPETTSRIGNVHDFGPSMLTLDVETFPYRQGMAPRLGVVEFLQVVSGYFDERHILNVAPNLLHPYGLTHAYGLKLTRQLEGVFAQLQQSRNTRRAVAHIGQPEDGYEQEKPCIQSYQFRVNPRTNRLDAQVFARSWDMYAGLPYDIMTAGGVTMLMARMLEVPNGRLTVFASSAHVYTANLEPGGTIARLTSTPRWDKWFLKADLNWVRWRDAREWAMDRLNLLYTNPTYNPFSVTSNGIFNRWAE